MFKKGSQVLVICGKDKGKKGEVIEILRSKNKIKIKGINLIKKHEKTTKEKKGGIITKENYIHLSNIKSLDVSRDKKEKVEVKK
jgi:large subunit ribosomal protein L24